MFFSGGQVWKFDTDVIIKSVTVNYWKVEAGISLGNRVDSIL